MCSACGCDWFLQMTQLVLYVTTFATGLIVSLSLGWTVVILDGHCLLGSDMFIQEITPNTSFRLVEEHTTWGSLSMCSYCTYTSVCAAIYSVIWIWCYLLVSDWSRQKTPWDFKDRG